MLPPTVIATLVIVVMAFSHPLDRPVFRCSAAIITALVAGAFMFPLAYIAEIIQGLATASAMFVPLALVAVTLLPLLDRGRVKFARWIAVADRDCRGCDGALGDVVFRSSPATLNFTYVVDADENRATYLAWSPNPLPATVTAAMPFAKGPTPLPWESREPPLVAPGDVDTARGDHARYPLGDRQHSNAAAATRRRYEHDRRWSFRSQVSVNAIRVNGLPVVVEEVPQTDYRVIAFDAPPATGVTRRDRRCGCTNRSMRYHRRHQSTVCPMARMR